MKCRECDREAIAKGLCTKHYSRAKSNRPPQPTRDMSPEERFDYYVEKTDCCWLWKGATFGPNRYGAFGYKKRTIGAHVFSYMRHHGPVTKGMFICHTCDNPACVNPDHLFAGTPKENTHDMMKKSRGVWPVGGSHHLAKLSDKDVEEIRLLAKTMNNSAIARRFGVSRPHVSYIVSGKARVKSQTPRT